MNAICSTCLEQTANGICVGWSTDLLCMGLWYLFFMLVIIGMFLWGAKLSARKKHNSL